MFNRIISNNNLPAYLSSDYDPYLLSSMATSLRVLDIEEIKTIPFTPISHPFIERLVSTIKRKYIDQLLFWNENDLQQKLDRIRDHNDERVLASHNLVPSVKEDMKIIREQKAMDNCRWQSHCGGLFQLTVAV